jgi:hypothetical protein
VVVTKDILHLSKAPRGPSGLLAGDWCGELGGVTNALGVDAKAVKGFVVR